MHILILGSYGPSVINFRGKLIEEMIAAGHEVSVGVPVADESLQISVEALGATLYDTPLQRNNPGILTDLFYFCILLKLIFKLKPGLILSYTIKPNIWGALAAWLLGVRSYSLITGLGFAFVAPGENASFKNMITSGIARGLYRIAVKLNQKVIFQNRDDHLDFFSASYSINKIKTAIVDGSGVDLQHFQRAPVSLQPKFLMIARLLNSKGVVEYATAARKIRELYPSASVALLGPLDDGPDSVDAEFVDSLQRKGTLNYLGATDDVRPFLADASIFVLPSYREGTPRSVLEAMAMGRPIITTDAPGCRETIRDGVEGFLVEPRNSLQLAEAMLRFIEDPALIAEMSENAYDRVVKKYDVKLINDQMMRELGLRQ